MTWFPHNKRDDVDNGYPITDEAMSRYMSGEPDEIGWTVKVNEDGSVSAFKNGRYIRDYVKS